jgi:hypothetical protein
MKKVLMVIFVLSLLGLLAAPVLANVLAESGPYNEVAPKVNGFREAGRESVPAGGEDPVQVARTPSTQPHPVARQLSPTGLPCWTLLLSASRASLFSEL